MNFFTCSGLTIGLFLILNTSCISKKEPLSEIKIDSWKFITGDSLAFADPGFNTDSWKEINPNIYWEQQGYEKYDGYAWYRASFNLSSALKENSWFKDSLILDIGKIDDTEQTFLNGKLLGQNGNLLPEESIPAAFENNRNAYRISRRYVISVNDPRLKWDEVNTLAIRVNDHMGYGGLYETGGHRIAMLDIKDFVKIDKLSHPIKAEVNSGFSKTVICRNTSSTQSFKGKFTVSAVLAENNREIYHESFGIELPPSSETEKSFTIKTDLDKITVAKYSFLQEGAKVSVTETEAFPFILTPPSPETPRINGPKVYGSRPGNEFLYSLPVSGKKPMTYTATNLPEGLTMNPETGIITGKTPAEGIYEVNFTAKNELGSDTKTLKFISGKQLALTPPMGWNSWNCWGLSVTADKVKQTADLIVSSGLRDHGWTYINIDDGWEAAKRNPDGSISGNEKFPDFRELSDYVHSKGLKLGIYSSPGPLTCGHYLGTYSHEVQDANTWASWGIDYIKYDWCSYGEIAKDNSLEELKKPYRVMQDALLHINRDIVYSLCQYGMGNVWEWGHEVDGNLWRTTGDIVDTWTSLSGIGFNQTVQSDYAKPGNWNDPDMLIVGWVGWGPSLHPTRLTVAEQYTHISLWALLSAPLLLGNDLSRLDDFTLNLLTNDEVIAINQDPLGKQAKCVLKNGNFQVWMKQMEDGSKAIGIFNLGENDETFDMKWSEIEKDPVKKVFDVWTQKDLTVATGFSAKILSHGVKLIRISSL